MSRSKRAGGFDNQSVGFMKWTDFVSCPTHSMDFINIFLHTRNRQNQLGIQ